MSTAVARHLSSASSYLPPTSSAPSSSSSSSIARTSSLSKDRMAATGASSATDRVASLKDGSSSSAKKVKKSKHREKKPSSMEQARRTLKILASLPQRAVSPSLPSPPPSRSCSPEPSPADSSSTLASSSASSSLKRSALSPPSDAGSDADHPLASADSSSKRRRADATAAAAEEADVAAKLADEVAARRRKRLDQVWDVDRFKRLNQTYRNRARELKHSGDARNRASPPSSTPTRTSLMTLVELTDSILLWVYAFWCEDQSVPGRMNPNVWRSMDEMKRVVRTQWEGVVKASTRSGEGEDAAKAMLGLCYLVDALCLIHTTVYEQNQLNSRTQRINSSPRPPTSATMPSSQHPHPHQQHPQQSGSRGLTADSPASLGSSSSSPGALSDLSSSALPPDYLPQVLALTTSLSRSLRLLSTSQQLLSYPVLRRLFPLSWSRAVASDIAGCGGDGGERVVDPEWPEGGWGWPLVPTGDMMGGSSVNGARGSGPGAGGMLPHLVVFGRSVLLEWTRSRKELAGETYDLGRGFLKQ